MSGRRLYVYFRVARDDEAAAVAALRGLHTQWRDVLDCELLRRADDGGAHVTLMETYRQPGGVAASVQARIEREAAVCLARWLVGERHVEVFEPCA